jgi:peroxiredoxin
MKESTESLAVGDRAPDFTLPAANREGTFSLSRWLQRGPLILEFLRGTW